MAEQEKRWAAVQAANKDWTDWFEAGHAVRDEHGWTSFFDMSGTRSVREYETTCIRQIRWHNGDVEPDSLRAPSPRPRA